MRTTNVVLQDFLTAVAIGVTFLTAVPDLAPINAGALRVGAIVSNAVNQAPVLAKALFPVGTADSQQYQLAELSEMLLNQTISLSDQIQNGLASAQSDLNAFLHWPAKDILLET